MWVPLVQAWADHPIAGYGPGSFPWVLQLTDYFQTSSWAPRHPDNAFFQLLAEGGILGLAAVVTVVATLLVPVLRGWSTAARWALATFVLASVGANPTDFAFLVVVAVAWTAYAVPRDIHSTHTREVPARPLRTVFAAGLVVVAVAYTMTAAAGIFYADARDSAEDRSLLPARRALDVAIALDPGMALYPRQRGTIDFLQGDESSAVRYLELATRLNPSDDLAWRTLALAQSAAGNADAAESALEHALATKRSNPANLLLNARWQAQRGRITDALDTLGEVVQSWPATVGAPGWEIYLPKPLSTTEVLEAAIRRWELDQPSLEPFSGQGLWLAVLGDRPDLVQAAWEASGVSESLAHAAVAVFRCDEASDRYLDELLDSDRRTQLYWQLRVRESARDGAVDEAAFRLLQIMSGYPIRKNAVEDFLNPIGGTGFSSDLWGYRRQSITWRNQSPRLPSPGAADVRWMLDPIGAMRAAGLEGRLPDCR
jgi:tetratricopeptide (TPR) repeat protein